VNGHMRLIHSILPSTVDLRVSIPEDHPSARNLGTERSGSGTIVDPSGYILTVHYVVAGAQSIIVTTAEGEQYPGELAADDQESGLALVKIRGEFPFLHPAPHDSIQLGAPALIVASAGEAQRRTSGGYVTSFEGDDGHWEYMLDKTIRVSAPNPGFGGGALVDFSGRLMGVVSLNLGDIAKPTLAIPIELYLKHEAELKQFGRVKSRAPRAWLGIYPQHMGGHVVIAGLVPGGPAEKAGIEGGSDKLQFQAAQYRTGGDVILQVDGKDIVGPDDLAEAISTHQPGEVVTLTILHDGKREDVQVTLGKRPDSSGSG